MLGSRGFGRVVVELLFLGTPVKVAFDIGAPEIKDEFVGNVLLT